MLNIKQLSVAFQLNNQMIPVVNHVCMAINRGEFVGLIGESGSGKSVTAMSILQLLPSHAHITGDIHWNGQSLADIDHVRRVRGSDIGVIFQNPMQAFNPVLTMGTHFIETIQHHRSVTKKDAQDIAIQALHRVRITDPNQRLAQYPHEFSLGMCQRAMIALTLCMQPSLLIADEPTASLDVTVQSEIMALLADINRDMNLAMLFISHDLGVVANNCHRVCIMMNGAIVESGPTSTIFAAPSHPKTQALIQAIPSLTPTHRPILATNEPPIVSAENLSVTFQAAGRPIHAVSGISFEVPPKSFTAIAGESGSGKSVTAVSLMGLLPPMASINGTVCWKGTDMMQWSNNKKRQMRGMEIGMIFQNPLLAFHPTLPIGAHFIEALQVHHDVTVREAEVRTIKTLAQVQMPNPNQRLHQYPHELSLGMCQRAMIALAICLSPSLLIADEPTASLDVTIQTQIMALLREINQSMGTTILFISHDLGVIAESCDRIYVMKQGRIVEHGSVMDVFTAPKHPTTQSLLDAVPTVGMTNY